MFDKKKVPPLWRDLFLRLWNIFLQNFCKATVVSFANGLLPMFSLMRLSM